MVALLLDSSVLEHQNMPGIHHGAQAVADNDGALLRARLAQLVQMLQDAGFGLRVDGRQGIVQQQQRCFCQQGAGNRHALALSARQRNPLLPDRCVIALGHARDVFVDAGQAGRVFDPGPGGACLRQPDVFGNRR